MNNTVHINPLTEALRLGEEVSETLPFFVEVLGQDIPRKLEKVQGTVSNIVY